MSATPNKGCYMRKFLMAFGLCALVSVGPACAADFYVLDVTDDGHAILLDPATITDQPNTIKRFHLADIGVFTLWVDNIMEVDCSTERWRKVSSVSHLAGGTLEDEYGPSSPGYSLDWNALGPDSTGAYIHDVVCKWPADKPTGDAVYEAPSFQAVMEQISNRLYERENEKK